MQNNAKRQKQLINVYVRQRPVNRNEQGRSHCVLTIPNYKELHVHHVQSRYYEFDYVFGPAADQKEVYYTVLAPLIVEVLEGYNCTVFAYGQTGTGKTHTIAGVCNDSGGREDLDAGLIPRAGTHIFMELDKPIIEEYSVRVSFVELYNEELKDLLFDGSNPPPLRMYEDVRQKGSIIIQNLSEVTVCSADEIIRLLNKGMDKRQTAATALNDRSSRSHSVFTIYVHIKERHANGVETVKTGKLNLVDLAGSENINRSGAVNTRAREAGNINQSLLTLGRVIKALVEQQAHIPYRGSKLTRILQDSLGGRTKTSIIATVSPSLLCIEETLSTLDYARRARYIKNCPEANQRSSKAQVIDMLTKAVETAKRDVAALRTGSGFFIDKTNYEELLSEQEKLNDVILSKTESILRLEELVSRLESNIEDEKRRWDELMESFEFFKKKRAEYRAKIKETQLKSRLFKMLTNMSESSGKKWADQNKKLLGAIDLSTTTLRDLEDKMRYMYERSCREIQIKEQLIQSRCETDELVYKNLLKVEARSQQLNKRVKKFNEHIQTNLKDPLNHLLDTEKQAVDVLDGLRAPISEVQSNVQQNNNQYNESVNPRILGMFYENVVDAVDEDMSVLYKTVYDFQNDVKTQFQNVAKVDEQIVAKHSETCSSMEKYLQGSTTKMKTLLENKLDDLKLCSDYVAEELEGTKSDIATINVLKAELDKMLMERSKTIVELSKTKTEIKDTHSFTEKQLESVLAGYASEMEVVKGVKEELVRHAEFRNHLSNVEHDLCETSNNLKTDAGNLQDETRTATKRIVNAVVTSAEETSQDVTNTTQNHIQIVQTNFTEFETLARANRESAQETLLAISNCNKATLVHLAQTTKAMHENRLLSSDPPIIVEDLTPLVPSGHTPQKTAYSVPRALEVSPAASLLQRSSTPVLESVGSLDVSSRVAEVCNGVEEVLLQQNLSLDEFSVTDGESSVSLLDE